MILNIMGFFRILLAENTTRRFKQCFTIGRLGPLELCTRAFSDSVKAGPNGRCCNVREENTLAFYLVATVGCRPQKAHLACL